LISSALNSVGGATSAVLAAYYPASSTASASAPQINVTS